MEINLENLKSQTTEALKALLDYSIQHETKFRNEYTKLASITQLTDLTGLTYQAEQYNGALAMYLDYSEIVRTLEDELGRRLEDIFIF